MRRVSGAQWVRPEENDPIMFAPRYYQTEAVMAVYRFWEKDYANGNPVVVAPTGSGKSIIIALLMQQAAEAYPGTRIICLADVKELIEQDSDAFRTVAPDTPFGIYSASLDEKDIAHDITFAQIQSCHRKAFIFGRIDFCIVDEAHMVNAKRLGMYRNFFSALKDVNPMLKIVGFTATPYRLGAGYIFSNDEDALFGGVAYDIPIDRLIDEGFLVRPVSYAGRVEANTDNIEHSSTGEFKEESATREFAGITVEAVADMVSRLRERKSILVFACGLDHARLVVDSLRAAGEVSVDMVSGETPRAEREALVDRVRNESLRWVVNVGVFTKGFDARCVDAIVLLRATESPALYVQCVGRGLRIHPGKTDCLVLDYGQNIIRHGPINCVTIRKKGKGSDEKRVLAKHCPSCEALIALAATVCPHCGAEMPAAPSMPNHDLRPSDAPILADGQARTEWRDVQAMRITRHDKAGKLPSMRVSYQLNAALWVDEWVCLCHSGYPLAKARQWLSARAYDWLPLESALKVSWPQPQRIKIKWGGKYPEILDWHFGTNLLVG